MIDAARADGRRAKKPPSNGRSEHGARGTPEGGTPGGGLVRDTARVAQCGDTRMEKE